MPGECDEMRAVDPSMQYNYTTIPITEKKQTTKSSFLSLELLLLIFPVLILVAFFDRWSPYLQPHQQSH
jgi:hypothetical protein